MPASIRTTLHSSPGGPVVGPVLVDTSRDDLHKGYQLVLESVNAHTTYAWSIAFKPESPDRTDSTAGLLAPEGSTTSTAKFNVDFEGAYLIRLIADAGLPTEDTKFIRARFLTRFGNLKLVAAGERRDENGVIPVDATPEGWSNDQNQNLQLLIAQIRRKATTGRSLWVDSNRGRDVGNNANDPANTYGLPGADPAATEDEVSFTAEGHGDFATVNEAITYASACVARGEPALSATNPYFVYIKPGLYTEDLVLVDHVHLFGELGGADARWAWDFTGGMPVVIRTANAGGNTHAFTPASDGALCLLHNIQLENTAVTTKPVIEHDRGFLALDNCLVRQQANGAAQGACIETIVAGGNDATLLLHKTDLISAANADDARWVVKFDSPGALLITFATLNGRSCLSMNESLHTVPNQAQILNSTINASTGYGIRTGGPLLFDRSTLLSDHLAKNFVIDGFGAGAGALAGDLDIEILWSTVGRVLYSGDFVLGDANLQASGVSVPEDSDDWLQFPDGAPLAESVADMTARTTLYHSAWRLPENQPAGALTVNSNSRFPYRNVQDVLDLLANIVNPAGTGFGAVNLPYPGGLTLNAAYEGIESYNPFVVGAGLGRRILADNGAVQIFGAVAPGTGTVDPLLRGGLQVDGAVDIGPPMGDGLGSEIFLEPDPYGFGPRATFGRNIWHNELTTLQPRAAPGAFIKGGRNDANGGYALWLMTNSSQQSGTTEQPRLILSAGRTLRDGDGNTGGGPIFIEAGDVQEVAGVGLGGHVWMAPGATDNVGDAGHIRIVCPDTSTPMVIQAANLYAAAGPVAARALGVSGTLHLATPDRHHAIATLATDTLAALVGKINAVTQSDIFAADAAGFLYLAASKRGVNSEVFVVGVTDLVGGWTAAEFFTGLGEIQESVSPGVCWPGTYPDFVDIACTAAGVLTVFGSIVATAGGAYFKWVVGAPPSPYTITNESIVGVDTTAGPGTVELPAGLGAADVGRIITVKYEAGGNPVTVDGNGVNIDGAANTPLAFLYESVDVYWDGAQWFTK